MAHSPVRVLVVSPNSYRAFKEYYPADLPVEELLEEQHKHRYQMFCDHLGWRSPHIFRDDDKKIECDAYDRENSIYSIAIDEDCNFLGSVRAYSTLHPYMLEEDEFGSSCYPGYRLPKDPDIYEGSRIISANSALYKGHRPIRDIRIGKELLLSHLELGLDMGVREMVATMPPVLLDKLYGRMGWDITRVGPPTLIRDTDGHVLDEGVPTQNYLYPINRQVEARVRKTTGLLKPVNDYGVSDAVKPYLLAHMSAQALIPHPHRYITTPSYVMPRPAYQPQVLGM